MRGRFFCGADGINGLVRKKMRAGRSRVLRVGACVAGGDGCTDAEWGCGRRKDRCGCAGRCIAGGIRGMLRRERKNEQTDDDDVRLRGLFVACGAGDRLFGWRRAGADTFADDGGGDARWCSGVTAAARQREEAEEEKCVESSAWTQVNITARPCLSALVGKKDAALCVDLHK